MLTHCLLHYFMIFCLLSLRLFLFRWLLLKIDAAHAAVVEDICHKRYYMFYFDERREEIMMLI